MVADAELLLVMMVMTPVELMVACRLLAFSAALSWFSVETWPAPVPKVMLVGRAGAGSGDSQRLAGQRRRAAARRLGNAGAEAERRSAAVFELLMVRLPLAVPVCSVMAPPEIEEAGAGIAAGGIDRRKQVGNGAGGADLVGAGGAGHEGQRLAVDRQGIARR